MSQIDGEPQAFTVILVSDQPDLVIRFNYGAP